MALTKQQRDPHPELVAVRKRLEECGYTRRQAGGICNQLSDDQCDKVLAAKDDKGVETAVKQQAPDDVSTAQKKENAVRFKQQQEEIAAALEKKPEPTSTTA